MPAAELSRVLLVDDEPDIQLVLRLGLEASGLVVAVAGSGPEAVALAATFRPQLVVLDVEMPAIDGIATLALLREASLQGTDAVFLTARADADALAALQQQGTIGILVKPVDPLRLGELLRELWARREPLQCSS